MAPRAGMGGNHACCRQTYASASTLVIFLLECPGQPISIVLCFIGRGEDRSILRSQTPYFAVEGKRIVYSRLLIFPRDDGPPCLACIHLPRMLEIIELVVHLPDGDVPEVSLRIRNEERVAIESGIDPRDDAARHLADHDLSQFVDEGVKTSFRGGLPSRSTFSDRVIHGHSDRFSGDS